MKWLTSCCKAFTSISLICRSLLSVDRDCSARSFWTVIIFTWLERDEISRSASDFSDFL